MLLQDKVVLVTGSTTGIGEATARRCAAEGARVMIHGLEEELAQVVSRDLGEVAAYVVADLAQPESPVRVIQAVIERFGRIDALMNNAAIVTRSTLDNTSMAFFDHMMAINLRAPLFLIQAALPHFRRQGKGTVLNTGSVNALCGLPTLLDYSISKGGLTTMTRNLANYLAIEKVRVNQLNLGWVTSPNEIALQIREGRPVGWEKNLPPEAAPTGRLLTPEEVAGHALFWLSDQSAPASGVVYELEQFSFIGGRSLRARL
jgi:NAD(P)-dependent dehydrogenase (short-subunit alcohol dehydrogenase family)